MERMDGEEIKVEEIKVEAMEVREGNKDLLEFLAHCLYLHLKDPVQNIQKDVWPS